MNTEQHKEDWFEENRRFAKWFRSSGLNPFTTSYSEAYKKFTLLQHHEATASDGTIMNPEQQKEDWKENQIKVNQIDDIGIKERLRKSNTKESKEALQLIKAHENAYARQRDLVATALNKIKEQHKEINLLKDVIDSDEKLAAENEALKKENEALNEKIGQLEGTNEWLRSQIEKLLHPF